MSKTKEENEEDLVRPGFSSLFASVYLNQQVKKAGKIPPAIF